MSQGTKEKLGAVKEEAAPWGAAAPSASHHLPARSAGSPCRQALPSIPPCPHTVQAAHLVSQQQHQAISHI